MYISRTLTGYDRSGQQIARRGNFLLLLQTNDSNEIFAVVRKVALQQLGHFMMGRANICGKWHTVSGAYGSDGLPMTVEKLPQDAVKLPDNLREEWNKGGGWNSAGSEAANMRKWAIETFKVRK